VNRGDAYKLACDSSRTTSREGLRHTPLSALVSSDLGNRPVNNEDVV
jgi:hypothetical protein